MSKTKAGPSPPRKISECVAGCEGKAPTMPSPGVLHDIKILGLESRNRRKYTEEAVKKARILYEGMSIYFDHSPHEPVRTFLSKFGVLRDVRFVVGDGLRGNLHYNAGHLYAPTFEGWAKNDPNEIGLSHMAFVKSHMEDGIEIVDEITSVESVDIVSRPATTKGLYESLQPMNEEMPPVAEVAEVPAVEPEAELDHMDHLAAMVASIFKDKSMDVKEKVKRVKKALACLDDGEEGAVPGKEEGIPEKVEEADEEATEEEGEDEKEEKKAEESFKRMEDRVGKLVSEALASIKRATGAKVPVSTPAKTTPDVLSITTFLSETKGL